MNKTINIPKDVRSNFEGYNFLAYLHQQLNLFDFEIVTLNFSDTTWFDANLCSALGALINHAERRFNQIELVNLRSELTQIFSKNHFLASFGGVKILDVNNTTIKYRKNKLIEDKLIKEFLDRELLNKPDFPTLSKRASGEIIRSIFEIYSNAILHGDCEYVYSCGQYFPRATPPVIYFTIVDIGKTIKKNVNEFLKKNLTGIQAIEWAIQGYNTTKPKDRNIPGGLGLKLICDFAKLNKGRIHIVSSDGFWEFNKGLEKSKSIGSLFPGTLVNLEFNLDDTALYYLNDETSNEIVF